MFILYEMKREVRLEPNMLGHDRVEAISDELNRQLANRVILHVGLCMSLWDIQEIKPAVIYPGDGAVHSTVKFRYVVFRPLQDEVIVGKIKRCTPEGVHVTLGFFEDILIPQEGLQHPSKFDEREQIWVWEYRSEDDEDGDDEVHELYMDKGESIRFRISGEEFNDTTPTPTGPQNPTPGSSSVAMTTAPPLEDDTAKVPYSLTVF